MKTDATLPADTISERGRKGVKTGATGEITRQALELTLQVISHYPSAKQKQWPLVLLSALVRQCLGDEEIFSEGLTGVAIYLAGHDLRRGMPCPEDYQIQYSAELPKRVRRYWAKLESTYLDEIHDLLDSACQDAGLDFSLRFNRDHDETGGAGNAAVYHFSQRLLKKPVTEDKQPQSDIQYQLERLPRLPLLTRWLSSYALESAVGAIFPVLFCLLLLCGIYVSMGIAQKAPGLGVMTWLGVLAGSFYWILWHSLTPMFTVGKQGVVKAPAWLSLMNRDDLLLERVPVRGERSQVTRVRLAAYGAQCPMCGGHVHVRPGGRAFHNRMIGACDNAPKEHVFSFDHVLRIGRSLEY